MSIAKRLLKRAARTLLEEIKPETSAPAKKKAKSKATMADAFKAEVQDLLDQILATEIRETDIQQFLGKMMGLKTKADVEDFQRWTMKWSSEVCEYVAGEKIKALDQLAYQYTINGPTKLTYEEWERMNSLYFSALNAMKSATLQVMATALESNMEAMAQFEAAKADVSELITSEMAFA